MWYATTTSIVSVEQYVRNNNVNLFPFFVHSLTLVLSLSLSLPHNSPLLQTALDLPEKNARNGTRAFCEFKGDKIAIGKQFYDNCRAICQCAPGGVLACKPIQCSHNFGPHNTKCLEWDIDPHFVPIAPNCCPEPKCKNGTFIVHPRVCIPFISDYLPIYRIFLLSPLSCRHSLFYSRRFVLVCGHSLWQF